jgi:LDH2 family malate/lactate/ureidoglycolate dehydrogenase
MLSRDLGRNAMPKIQADRLEEIGRALFIAAGTPKDEAALVMRHIVGANLVGHDSHGVIQIPTYIERIKVGHIVPGAPWVIVKESANHTVIDGHWAFGYVANDKAMRLTIEKAEKGQCRGGDGVPPGTYRSAVEL